MDAHAVLSEFLKQKNTNGATLSSLLVENQQQIISSFGGLGNMIELCLTNPNASQYMNDNSNPLNSFAQLLQTIDNTVHENDTGETKINTQAESLTVSTAIKFYLCKLTIDCYPTNNLLFILMSNLCTNTKISFPSVYNYILSKQLILIVLFLNSTLIIAWAVAAYFDAISDVLIIILMFGAFIRILYCMALVSTVNITMVDLITNTFDFWFKVYNVLIWIISLWINAYNINEYGVHNAWDSDGIIGMATIVDQLSQMLVFFMFFIEDAIPLSVNAKKGAIILFTIAATINVMFRYFFLQDFQWNPFNSEYTKISFKSIIISSQINLIIFISKPILSDIMRYLRNRICGIRYTYGNKVTENYNCHRCATIYKRPYLKWYKIKPSIDNGNGGRRDHDADRESVKAINSLQMTQNIVTASNE